MGPDRPGYAADWTYLASTPGADMYDISPRAVAVVPRQDLRDTESAAREVVAFLNEHLRKVGGGRGIVVLIDRVLSQDRGSRTVYQTEPDVNVVTCVALIGGSPFGRAVASVFLGVGHTAVPTRAFATLEEGLRWIEESATGEGRTP